MLKRFLLAAAIALSVAAPALADDKQHAGAADALAEGEVRKVDKDAKKITIRHGPLPGLDMPAMTMVFQVADNAMLEAVKPGDKVKFQAEKVGGAFRVTKIERR